MFNIYNGACVFVNPTPNRRVKLNETKFDTIVYDCYEDGVVIDWVIGSAIKCLCRYVVGVCMTVYTIIYRCAVCSIYLNYI